MPTVARVHFKRASGLVACEQWKAIKKTTTDEKEVTCKKCAARIKKEGK